MVTRNRHPSVWFWIALIAVISNKDLLQLLVQVLEQGLHLIGIH
jgi:hypothetical protein